jgi:transcriptional regulator with XRE-family HTH domain
MRRPSAPSQMALRLGIRLRSYREQRDLTVIEVARGVGLTHQHVCRIELGMVNVPLDTILRFSVYYGISLEEMFRGLPHRARVKRTVPNPKLLQNITT